MDILTTWNCEELLVAYGHYANTHSAESYNMLSPKERAQHKDSNGRPAPLSWIDKWAVLFVTPEQMAELASDTEQQTSDDDLTKAAHIFFGA